jgi:protein-disulfide isomerase
MAVAVMGNQAQLLNDKNTPAIGPDNAKVAVIEFFDYQCVYCSKFAPELKNVMTANPGVKFMFKEWPIFGSRWRTSQDAARHGLVIWKNFGAQSYMVYHDALYQTGHVEGALTEDDINAAVQKAASDKKGNPVEVDSEIEANNELAQKLGLTGTPGLIIMPVTDATPDKITVLPGVAPQAVIEEAIAHAAK